MYKKTYMVYNLLFCKNSLIRFVKDKGLSYRIYTNINYYLIIFIININY